MKLPDVLEYITVGLTSDRFKTLMSSLGIIIGVMAIVVMLSVGEGLYSGVFGEFSGLDLDVIHVTPGSMNMDAGGPPSFRSYDEPAHFTETDVKTIENVVGVKSAAPQVSTNVILSFRAKNASAQLTAVSPDAEDDLKEKVATGRFLMDSDYKSIVVGYGVSENVFRMKISPGNRIRLYHDDRYMDFKVVGVLEKENDTSFSRNNPNEGMYITHRAMEDLLDEENYYYDNIQVTVIDTSMVDSVVDEIEVDLRRFHKDEAYSVTTSRSMLTSLESVLSMIKYALGGIGAISLLVGGIGISNVMMLTVQDRIREIGVLKALGATTREIMIQYMLEAGVLGVVSSFIGIIISFLVSAVIAAVAGIPSVVTAQSVLVGLLFGVVTTTLAGAYPATKAAKLDPIEALRSE